MSPPLIPQEIYLIERYTSADSRRYFRQGEVMPALGGDYGDTFWQWSPDQTMPRL